MPVKAKPDLGGFTRFLRPLPAGHIGPVSPVFEGIIPAGDLFIVKSRQGGAADSLQSGNVLNRIHGQSETIDPILDRQFQGGIDVALFPIAVHVHVRMVGAAVSQPVDEPGISVKIENDWFIDAEEQVEITV